MTYRQPITQTPYPGMPMQQPVVGMPYPQPYYPNYQNQMPQPIKLVNQTNIVKTPNTTAPDYHIDYSIRNQMNSLKKLIERAENLRNSKDSSASPFEIRWRNVTNPFPSFWKFENDHIFNLSESMPPDFSPIQNDPNLSMNYPKINEPRIPPNISTLPSSSSATIPNNASYNGTTLPPRSQSPQVSVVATNFIPQRQPSPEIVVNGIPPKNIITNQTNYSNGIPPSNIIISNNNTMQRSVNDFDVTNTNPINQVTINNMAANNYNNPINTVTINSSAPNSGYNYSTGPYNNTSNFAPNTNYNDPNNYNNPGYSNTGYNYSGYNNNNANTNNNMYNNVYNKGNYTAYNNNNPNNNLGYRKQGGYKPNNNSNNNNNNNSINNSKKHNARKRNKDNPWTYKPGNQE